MWKKNMVLGETENLQIRGVKPGRDSGIMLCFQGEEIYQKGTIIRRAGPSY